MIDQFMQQNDTTIVRFPVLDSTGNPADLSQFVQAVYKVTTLTGQLLWQGTLGDGIVTTSNVYVVTIPGMDYVGSVQHECRVWDAVGNTQTPLITLMSILRTSIPPVQPN